MDVTYGGQVEEYVCEYLSSCLWFSKRIGGLSKSMLFSYSARSDVLRME